MPYLPWWLGAPALAAVTVGFHVVTRRTMGVTGSIVHAVEWRGARDDERARDELGRDAAALEEALLSATLEEFGATASLPPLAPLALARAPESASSRASAAAPPTPPLTASEHATFLVAIFGGAALLAWVSGGTAAVPAPRPWLALAVGGFLAGFGARMAGGCTTGHGLSGCSRLSKASLVATAAFFASAVAATTVIAWLGAS